MYTPHEKQHCVLISRCKEELKQDPTINPHLLPY
jgi:hypothetical protein